jgi:hypothetical protein
MLLNMIANRLWMDDVWSATINGLALDNPPSYVWRLIAPRIFVVPKALLRNSLSPFCRWFQMCSKAVPVKDDQTVSRLSDRLFSLALVRPMKSFRDPVSTALNVPVGVLTEALLDRVWLHNPTVGGGLLPGTAQRLARLVSGHSRANVIALILVAARLESLHAIDRRWTRKYLLPHFKWRGNANAAYVWQGYLWSGRINGDLLADIKKDLVLAVRNANQFVEFRQVAYQLFALATLEFKEQFNSVEIRDVLRAFGPDGRAEVAHQLFRRADDAGDKRAVYWQNRIQPWLEEVWPNDRVILEPKTSEFLALSAVVAGSHFPTAVETVVPLLTQTPDYSFVLHILKDKDHPEKYPRSCMRLLAALVSTRRGWSSADLGAVLSRLKKAEPEIEADLAYRTLAEYVRTSRG